MKTLLLFESAVQSIPQSTAWYLADLGEYLGKQELYMRQVPRLPTGLKALQCLNLCRKMAWSNVSGVDQAPYGRKRYYLYKRVIKRVITNEPYRRLH